MNTHWEKRGWEAETSEFVGAGLPLRRRSPDTWRCSAQWSCSAQPPLQRPHSPLLWPRSPRCPSCGARMAPGDAHTSLRRRSRHGCLSLLSRDAIFDAMKDAPETLWQQNHAKARHTFYSRNLRRGNRGCRVPYPCSEAKHPPKVM